MVSFKLYVEGGGDSASLLSRCREGFRGLLEKTACRGRMPRIVACGSRSAAYDHFRTACAQGEPCLLLVDSEDLVTQGSSWEHLRLRNGDGWEKPAQAREEDCHLMVVCMESWFLADKNVLRQFFGQGFNESALPTNPQLEKLTKAELFHGLQQATRSCKTKAPYGKGEHSFQLLKQLSPEKVAAASPWAKRFLDRIILVASGT